MASKGPPSRKKKHFVTTDVWSPRTFWRNRDFVTSDVCHSLFFLSGCFGVTFCHQKFWHKTFCQWILLLLLFKLFITFFSLHTVKSPNFDFAPKVPHPLLKFLNHHNSLCISFSHIVSKGKMHLILFYIRKKIWGLHWPNATYHMFIVRCQSSVLKNWIIFIFIYSIWWVNFLGGIKVSNMCLKSVWYASKVNLTMFVSLNYNFWYSFSLNL